ncbi:MAG: M1 family metallopeptidase [Ignavibacteria bacterium]|nr:M1 family metallopeptidase [Ignavibacteria bacterium]
MKLILHAGIILALTLFFASQLAAQGLITPSFTQLVGNGTTPREHPADMLRLKLDVKFDAFTGTVYGRVMHTFKVLQQSVDSIEFDAMKITFQQVLIGNKPARYRQTDTTVIVYCEPRLNWDRVDSISFTYSAKPRRGIYFVGWSDSTGTMRRQIWTQGQGIDTRHYIPLYDEMNDKVISETIITFDSSYKVLSNGNLISGIFNSDGTKTWHYAMTKPQAPYLIMIAVGKYAIADTQAHNKVPMHLYYYADLPETREPTYRYSTEGMDFLESEIGVPYPWESYSQIPLADFIFGAMENTTATTFGDFYVTDERGWLDRFYVNTNVHELTHQWFGDLVTARSIAHNWLQESFATYYPHVYTKIWQGEDAYQYGRRHLHSAALAAGMKDRFPVVHVQAGGSRVYQKGAAVLDMMRYTFGADQLKRVIQHYLRHHAYSNVETNDLFQSFQDTLGISPNWFFNQWLYQGGEPEFTISYAQAMVAGIPGISKATIVNILQTHETDNLTGYFTMPVHVEVHYIGGGTDTALVTVSGAQTTVTVPNATGKAIAFVLFDPGSYVLKRVVFSRTHAELLAQAENAPNMIDRFDAMLELQKPQNAKLLSPSDIERMYNRETFHATKSALLTIAIQQKKSGVKGLLNLIERGLTDPDVQVRKHMVANLRVVDLEVRSKYELLLTDPSYSIIEDAFQKLCLFYPSDRQRYIGMVSMLTSPGMKVEIAVLEQRYLAGDEKVMSDLAELSGNKYEFITRQNAMRAIKRCGVLTGRSFANMVDALNNANTRLSDVANQTLSWFAEQPRFKALMLSEMSKIREQDRTALLAIILL